MGSISTKDARGVLTKALIDVYKERTVPMSFLRSFFQTVESTTKNISIEVQRGTERIAVDVERGTEGNRNSFAKSSEKIFTPPYYVEYFDATELDLYDKLFGTGDIDSGQFAQFIDGLAEKLRMLQDKIERSYELQCAQVLSTGIVTLNAGTNIDFKRKAASLVALSGDWTSGAVDPIAHILAGAKFIREVGKSQGANVNVILGESVLSAFLNNTLVKSRADIRNFFLDNIAAPQRNSVGGTLHGEVSAGAYKARIWTYSEVYEDASGTVTPYINAKQMIVLPENPRFKLAFAAVPQLLTEGQAVSKGAYRISDYKDQRKTTHDFEIKSAGVAVPTAVDQIYTRTVIA